MGKLSTPPCERLTSGREESEEVTRSPRSAGAARVYLPIEERAPMSQPPDEPARLSPGVAAFGPDMEPERWTTRPPRPIVTA